MSRKQTQLLTGALLILGAILVNIPYAKTPSFGQRKPGNITLTHDICQSRWKSHK